jgi:hypothetical protein
MSELLIQRNELLEHLESENWISLIFSFPHKVVD